jgi:hypothetical protein
MTQSDSVAHIKPMPSSRRRKTREDVRRRGIPPPVVFWFLVVFTLGSAAAAYLAGTAYLLLVLLASILTGVALYVNDHKGFIRSPEMRRAYQTRHHFNSFEVLVLVVSLVCNAVLAAYLLIR